MEKADTLSRNRKQTQQSKSVFNLNLMSLGDPHYQIQINVCSRVYQQQQHDDLHTDFGNLIHWLALSRCTALPSQEATSLQEHPSSQIVSQTQRP